eukprot:1139746-Pelagomonas_calceolata.AAC.1
MAISARLPTSFFNSQGASTKSKFWDSTLHSPTQIEIKAALVGRYSYVILPYPMGATKEPPCPEDSKMKNITCSFVPAVL